MAGPLVFVDIETNGGNYINGRVIEVAAIRVEQGKIVERFRSLVDPETELPFFITNLTGITNDDVAKAPTFDQIADDLQAVLKDAVFVAHNVRFDYSFLKQEFLRLGIAFSPRQLCTVKLSRALYPQERSHKLESLIQRHGFQFTHRHRAYDDAHVLWQFVQHAAQNFPPEQILAAVAKQLKQPSIPTGIDTELVRGLPEGPGVYIFEDESGRPLYIGKSVNIKKRVLSHFSRDHAEVKEFKIAQQIKHITTHETAGEMAALLLESRLVKELQPIHNRKLRRQSKLTVVRRQRDEAGYDHATIEECDEITPADSASILAVYPYRSKARSSLSELSKTFELCPKLMGLEKASSSCFMRQLKKCRGACEGAEPPDSYNARLSLVFERQRIQAWPYAGPVVIEERPGAGTTKQAFIVDQWCVLGEILEEPYCEPRVQLSKGRFDLDTYKILQLFLTSKLNKLKVRHTTHEQLAALMQPV